MTLDAFRSDPIARRAAAYAVQTISEAVRHIPDDWLCGLPDGAVGADQGHRQSHSITSIFVCDDAILWDVITKQTHALKSVMEAMLARHSDAIQRPDGVVRSQCPLLAFPA